MALHQHHFLILLVLCFLLCGALAAPAAPASRSLKSVDAYFSTQDTTGATLVWTRMRSTVESNARGRRMDVELTDYPDPGANPGHEPEPVTPPEG